MKISAVYKIKNTITGDFYIGSSKNVKQRWANHCCPSKWAEHPNSPMYQDMQKYGIDKFVFTYVCFVEPTHLKQVEQEVIELLQPTYNQYSAYLYDTSKYKYDTSKYKYDTSKYVRAYYKRNNKKVKEYVKGHYKKNRQHFLDYHKVYDNRPCLYNGTKYKFRSLLYLFRKQGIENPTQEAKKYLIKKDTD